MRLKLMHPPNERKGSLCLQKKGKHSKRSNSVVRKGRCWVIYKPAASMGRVNNRVWDIKTTIRTHKHGRLVFESLRSENANKQKERIHNPKICSQELETDAKSWCLYIIAFLSRDNILLRPSQDITIKFDKPNLGCRKYD